MSAGWSCSLKLNSYSTRRRSLAASITHTRKQAVISVNEWKAFKDLLELVFFLRNRTFFKSQQKSLILCVSKIMIRFLACCFVTFCISSAILLLLYNYLRRKVEENLIDKKSYNFVLRTLIYSVLKFVHIPLSSALYYVTIESLSEWRWRARLNKVIHQSNFLLTDLFLAIYFFHFQKKKSNQTIVSKILELPNLALWLWKKCELLLLSICCFYFVNNFL